MADERTQRYRQRLTEQLADSLAGPLPASSPSRPTSGCLEAVAPAIDRKPLIADDAFKVMVLLRSPDRNAPLERQFHLC
jgi:hypothetical protein